MGESSGSLSAGSMLTLLSADSTSFGAVMVSVTCEPPFNVVSPLIVQEEFGDVLWSDTLSFFIEVSVTGDATLALTGVWKSSKSSHSLKESWEMSRLGSPTVWSVGKAADFGKFLMVDWTGGVLFTANGLTNGLTVFIFGLLGAAKKLTFGAALSGFCENVTGVLVTSQLRGILTLLFAKTFAPVTFWGTSTLEIPEEGFFLKQNPLKIEK